MIIYKKILICLLCVSSFLLGTPVVVPVLTGQLGNQLFQIATAVSLALDHGAEVTVPDLKNVNKWGIPLNKEAVFWKINTSEPKSIQFHFKEKGFNYHPILYYPNMKIEGYFQSEKYFKEYKDVIVDLFSPKESILQDLKARYSDIIEHPETVAIHVRTYIKDDPQHKFYCLNGRKYLEEAMSYFPDDAYFIVFSDNIPWCKTELAGLGKNIRFIENDTYINDFYLMTLCKNHIISNSSFSWWAAYLNKYPYKLVIAPKNWFTSAVGHDTSDLIPDEWIEI